MSGIVNQTGAVSGVIGTTVGTPESTNASALSSGTLPAARLPAGSVVQVVNSSNSYDNAVTSTTLTDIQSSSGVTWETSITPTVSGNKILVMYNMWIRSYRNTGGNSRGGFSILQLIAGGSYTTIATELKCIGLYDYGLSGVWDGAMQTSITLVSPSTDLLIKYKAKMAIDDAVSIRHAEDGAVTATSHCTLMEVVG